MKNNKPKINISISREHEKDLEEIVKVFEDFDVHANADYMRFSAESLPMQVFIFLVSSFAGGAAWDLLKFAITKLYRKFPKAHLTLRGNDSIMYTIRNDFTINVVVAPDRIKEFEHIKTLDDLIHHMESKKDEK